MEATKKYATMAEQIADRANAPKMDMSPEAQRAVLNSISAFIWGKPRMTKEQELALLHEQWTHEIERDLQLDENYQRTY